MFNLYSFSRKLNVNNNACSIERLLFEEGGTYVKLRHRGERNEVTQDLRKGHHPNSRQPSGSQRS